MTNDETLANRIDELECAPYETWVRVLEKGDDMPMKKEDAMKAATHVLNFFGYADRIIDNILEPNDRDVFYMLEEMGILETERDESHISDYRGRGSPKDVWRIHYWKIKFDKMKEILRKKPELKQQDADISIYKKLSDEAWDRSSASATG